MSKLGKEIPVQLAVDPTMGFGDTGGACTEAEPFALMVKGDSMEPEFMDGHIIIVDPSMPPINECYVVVAQDDGHIFRQLVIAEGKKYLKPLHDGYPVQELEHKNAIVGVITQRAGTRRKDRKHYV